MDEFSIKPSLINGKGLFTKRRYAKDEKVSDFVSNYTDTALINHSCEPSCYIIDGKPDVFYAKHDLNEDEEITVDYVKEGYIELWERTIKDKCTCNKCLTK